MAPPKQLTTLLLLLIANTPSLVLSQPPYYFNPFQNQQPHRFQQNTYQPFTNAPTYYQPTYQSHSPGGGGEGSAGRQEFNNFFTNLPAPTPPSSSRLVTYPTHESTVSGAPGQHHLSSPQAYQPVGNNLIQQSPTSPTTTFSDNNAHFRPSPLVHHNTHIVNGLPRQQFFGNNYEFFRQRHGLTNLPPTTGPFFQPHQSNNAVSSPPQPSPTPSVLLSPTSTAQPPRISENKPSTQKSSSVSPKPTQPTVVSRFPNFNSLSPFSPAPSPAIQATTASPPRSISTARPTSPSTSAGVSPAFQFSQFFTESDTNGSNELVRSPLFGEDEEEEVDDESYTLNNNNNIYDERRQQQQQQQQQPPRPFSSPAPIIPHQRSASPTAYTSPPLSSPYKSQPFSNGVNSVSTYAASKDEPAPVRVHNTTPIRIVFNYEQALEALQENPGVRVVVAHTEKNNLTEQEFSTARPAYSPLPSVTTPRPTTSQILYQSTTGRPSETATHRPYNPIISSTQRPQPQQVPTRFDYNSGGNLYTVTGRTTTTAAALENLALELEGRFSSTGRPPVPSLRPNYETVATYATEPTYTESPLKTYQRGPKKYVVVPGSNLFKSQEPRVVVNDLASIHVQTLPPGSRPPYFPTQPTFPARPSYAEYEDEVDDADLQEEIENLSQQLEIATTIPTTTTTTTTTTPRPPRIRITSPTPRLKITTYRPPGTYRTTPRQAPRVIEDDHVIHELPENSLAQEPPQSGRNQQPSYYYNNMQRGGLSGAYQRYEYNDGVDAPPPAPQQQIEEVRPVRRRQRVRGRLIAGSPPRPVQVSSAVGPLGAMLIQPGIHVGPVPFGSGPPAGRNVPVGPAPALPGPVFRVGPKGRLLRRKIRPRNQQASATASPTQETRTSSLAPSSPSAFPDFPPVPQGISSDGPPPFASLYNPSPFIPTQVPFSVTTFRPPQPNLLVQQNLVAEEQDDDRRVVNTPNTFRSRFRFSPSRATTSTTIRNTVEEEEEDSNQYESEEEAPVPQRRRPQQFSTTSTTEKPSSNQVLSDRANILQRQIRFNRNKKSNQNNNQRNS